MPGNDSVVPTNPSAIAIRLAAQFQLWSPLIAFDPMSRYYVRLLAEPAYEAWLLTWLPGQGTDWHDHGHSAGAFVVLSGDLTEESAARTADADIRVLPDAGRLLRGSLRSFDTSHIHRVTNNGWEPAVSLHVYSPALVEMNQYIRLGDALRLTRSSLVGVNW